MYLTGVPIFTYGIVSLNLAIAGRDLKHSIMFYI